MSLDTEQVLLESVGLTVSYGGLHANDNVDLRVVQGNVVGLIGPNGAGKTTFIDAITGFTPPTRGEVRFDGQRINDLSPAQRAEIGLTRTFQSLELFDDLTVWDNLLVPAETPSVKGVLLDFFRPSRKQATTSRPSGPCRSWTSLMSVIGSPSTFPTGSASS